MHILRSLRTLAFALMICAGFAPGELSAQDASAVDFTDLPVQNATTVQEPGSTPVASPEASPVADVELRGYIVGDPDAPVTLQIYADYQCPHCRNFYNTIEPQLVADYVATGKVKLELLDFTVVGVPSIQALDDDSLESVQAAEAAMCAAEQGAYLEYYQTLFSGEMTPNSGAFSNSNLKAFAADLGLDTDVFDDCLDSGKYEPAIISYVYLGVERGVPGTPSLSIDNGEIFSVGSYEELQGLLDEALGE
jgi:protein-disulfide isomerase